MSDKICVVTGVGPGLGIAYARRFTAGGYRVALMARNGERLEDEAARLEGAVAVPCDVSDPDAVHAAFERVRSEMGRPDVVVHNAGTGVFKGFLDTTADEFALTMNVNVGGLFHVAQEAIPDMVHRGRGALLVTGATAAWRGGPNTAAFAAAKGGQRWLAQSIAKEFAPKGVHVAYLIIDGMVDLESTRARMPDRADADFISPRDVADTAWHIAHQPVRAWTFELDLRPAPERW